MDTKVQLDPPDPTVSLDLSALPVILDKTDQRVQPGLLETLAQPVLLAPQDQTAKPAMLVLLARPVQLETTARPAKTDLWEAMVAQDPPAVTDRLEPLARPALLAKRVQPDLRETRGTRVQREQPAI